MRASRLGEESGYSLVEVMASIVILTIAIIPMVGMFDMGLTTATRGGNYDKARTLANLKLEQAKSMTFDNVAQNFPEATTYNGSGYSQSGWVDPDITDPGPAITDFTNFDYRVEKQYMSQPPAAPSGPSQDFAPCDPTSTEPTIACSPGTNFIKVTVTVRWPDGNTYTTFGLVTR